MMAKAQAKSAISSMGAGEVVARLPDGKPLLPTLSSRQLSCLQYISQYAEQTRDYPNGPEIAARLGITKQAISSLLSSLINKGYLVRDRNFTQRNIRLTALGIERLKLEEGERKTAKLF